MIFISSSLTSSVASISLTSSIAFWWYTGLTDSFWEVDCSDKRIWALSSPLRCIGICATRAITLILCHLEDAIERAIFPAFMEAPIVVFSSGWNFSPKRVPIVVVLPAPSAPSVTSLNWLEEREPSLSAIWYALNVFASILSVPELKPTYKHKYIGITEYRSKNLYNWTCITDKVLMLVKAA